MTNSRSFLMASLFLCTTHMVLVAAHTNGSCPGVGEKKPHGVSLLQRTTARTSRCPHPAPHIDGTNVKHLIQQNKGLLIIGMPNMACTKKVVEALQQKGAKYTMKQFTGAFAYTKHESSVWDWLHCKYSKSDLTDRNAGTIMHSYVFLQDKFVGQGFKAADTILSGSLDDQFDLHDSDIGSTAELDCSSVPDSANSQHTVEQLLAAGPVVLFGWLGCPCVKTAQTRFSSEGLCLKQRTWANPKDSLMAYLQCKVSDPASHSFIFFKQKDGTMKFVGNGFKFDDEAMGDAELKALISDAGADTTCASQATDKKNIYGGALEECRVGTDPSGSWMDDGTCTEEFGGVHQICLENIPADFSTKTHQSAWSEERAGKRHCVCVGAWSLYMTEEETNPVLPHCKAIPTTVFTTTYIENWKDWNGVPAKIQVGVSKLVEKCLSAEDVTDDEKCTLKANFEKLKSKESSLSNVNPDGLSALSC